jgi:hypothetical protein
MTLALYERWHYGIGSGARARLRFQLALKRMTLANDRLLF